MYDAWSKLGEGKKNFFARDPYLKTYKTQCVIWSTIKFDETVKTRVREIKGMNQYLAEKNIPTRDISYWQYFTQNDAPTVISDEDIEDTIVTRNNYLVIYALSVRTTAGSAIDAAIAGAGGAKAGAFIGTLVTLGNPVGGLVGGGIGFVLVAGGTYFAEERIKDWLDKNEGYFVTLALIPEDAEAIDSFGCEEIQSIT